MQIETIGKYQLHFVAYELPGSGKWEPFVSIYKFDEDRQDFVCVLEKHRVSEQGFANYGDAMEAARHAGNALLAAGHY